jgi:hypothetical protein
MTINAMSTKSSSNFYEQVESLTSLYLGPSANRLIAKQVENHLNKKPRELCCNDMPKSIDWIRAAVVYLTEDGRLVEEYTSELRKLSRQTYA